LPSSPEWALQSWEDDLTGSEDNEPAAGGSGGGQHQNALQQDTGIGMDLAVWEETDLVDSKLGQEFLSLFAQGSSSTARVA